MPIQPNLKELCDALQTIKEECKKHNSSCSCCPFCHDSMCGITCEPIYGQYDYKKQPAYWNIPSGIQLLRKVEVK